MKIFIVIYVAGLISGAIQVPYDMAECQKRIVAHDLNFPTDKIVYPDVRFVCEQHDTKLDNQPGASKMHSDLNWIFQEK